MQVVFEQHISCAQVCTRAGLRREGARFVPTLPPMAGRPQFYIEPSEDGRTALVNWPGFCPEWDWPRGFKPRTVTAWPLFVLLVAGGDRARAVKMALRVPALKEAAAASLGGLAHV